MQMKNNILMVMTFAVLCTGLAGAKEASVKKIITDLEPAPAKSGGEGAQKTDAVLKESQALYANGEFERAEVGLKAVLATEPQNSIAKLYLEQINKILHRNTEEDAMDAVSEGWRPGEEQRYYSLSEKALTRMGLVGVTEPVHVESKLQFVKFPEGAEAVYRPSLKKLSVRNTFENHQRIKELLAAFGEAETKALTQQVKIETRFVEFSEGALEELGFNWSAPDGAGLTGDWALETDQNLFSGALRSVPYSKAGELGLGEVKNPSSQGWSVNRLEDMFSDEAGTLEVSGELASNPIDLLVRALDQTSGADVLSAPSIVTLSGEQATIKVGERHNYPSIYEEGVSMGTVLHVRYEDFEEKILGVEMDVTPTIEGEEINLKINPKITELVGWQQFELAPADTSYTYYQFRVGMQYEHESVIAKLPVFKRREIETEISITSGSTVGMGGLISEKVESFEDRVPVLGSIPLVGRLFRSEGERSVKCNLMIFVTASKVSPSGRIISERSYE